jgi:biopolymer transport protein ExbB
VQWRELWEHLGWPALIVAGVLVVMGVASLAVFVERLVALRRSRAASRAFAATVARDLRPGAVDRVIAEADRFTTGHLARLVRFGLVMYRDARAGLDGPGLTPVESMRRELERRIEEIVADLKAGLPVLASVGSVAPFVGLLGTVLGIITAFRGIAETGSGGLSAVSAGIAEALVETALGLAVAIPSVLAFNCVATQIAHDQLALTNAAGELIDKVERWGDTQVPASGDRA